MEDTTRLYLALRELPRECRYLIYHLAMKPEPFTLSDAVLPPGGRAAWESAVNRLWRAGFLQRVGWGQSPRYRIPASARQAVDRFPPPSDSDAGLWSKRAF
jgi:hypothetical protein